jgi:hypothetical protein
MTNKQSNNLGGARPGSGRKVIHPEGKTIPLVASVPASLVERLMVIADKKGWNRSEAVTEAVRAMLKRHDRRTGVSIPSAEADPTDRV